MLCWLDLETTGLNPREDAILEVGLIVTTDDLEEVFRTSRVCRYLGSLERVAPNVRAMHEASGLWAECARTEQTALAVEQELVSIMSDLNRSCMSNGHQGGPYPLCGSTIGFDRSFLREQMPDLLACFHYRSIDVSTLTELARRWFPVYVERPGADESKRPHRALPDLENSIALLKYYRQRLITSDVRYRYV